MTNGFLELKNSNFIDKITCKKVNDETIKLLQVQKDSMIKFLMKIPQIILHKKSFPFRNIPKSF